MATYCYKEKKATENQMLTNSDNLISYMEGILNIQFNDCIAHAEGEATIKENEEVAVVKMKVLAENERSVMDLLEKNFVKIGSDSVDEVPPFPRNSLLSEIETKNWRYTFLCVREGKRAKTREIFIYVVSDETGTIIYFWG